MRVYWRVKRPLTHGALVTLWHRGEVRPELVRLVLQLTRRLRAPGRGGPRCGRARAGEEIGLAVRQAELVPVLDVTHDWEGKRDRVEIFSLDVDARPEIRIDHREIIDAAWFSKESAFALNLFPPLWTAIEAR